MIELDEAALRKCLGTFATGVTVVTCEVDDRLHGATVSSFTSVSLDPPLVLVCLHKKAKAARHLEGRPFTVNVLSAEQRDHALHFAGREQPHLELTIHRDERGARLEGCLAYVVCDPWDVRDAGDHNIVLGKVTGIEFAEKDPLLFYRGGFWSLGSAVATESGAAALAVEVAAAPTLITSDLRAWDGYDVFLHQLW